MFVILNVAFARSLTAATSGLALGSASPVAFLFLDQVKVKNHSQLINDISIVLQKLFKCFHGTTISTSFSVLLPSNLPVILVL